MLYVLLAAVSAFAAPKLTVIVDPPNPPPATQFRLVLRAESIACAKITKFSGEIAADLLKIGESQVEGKSGCERIYILSTLKTGSYPIRNLRVESPLGTFTAADTRIPVGDQSTLPKPAPKDTRTPEERLREWVNQAKFMLGAYLSSEKLPGKFTVESCRIPLDKLVSLLMKNTASFTHTFAFQQGCDLNGELTLQLGSPTPFDLQVRNVDPIQRMKGTLTLTAAPTLNFEFKVAGEITNGTFYEHANQELAKFEYRHDRTLQLNVRTLQAVDARNLGRLKVTEFQGGKVDFDEKFELRELEIQSP